MNDPERNESLRQRRRFIIIKALLIGTVTGALLTVGSFYWNANTDSHNYGPAIILGIVSIPSIPVFKLMGYHLTLDASSSLYILISANSCSYSLIGAGVGWLLSILRKKDQ